MATTNKYCYAFVREDLPNVVKLVQTSHACMEMGFVNKKPDEQVFLVVLSVANERALMRVSELLDRKKIKHEIFYEPDFDYGYTALCTEPVFFGEHKLFEKYNLLEIQ